MFMSRPLLCLFREPSLGSTSSALERALITGYSPDSVSQLVGEE